MQFCRLNATFGKLEHCTLPLSEGLNIIEAPNESGKSTLLAFLRAMLYGLPTRERGALADKNRYAPWSLAPMQGTLELSCALGNITIRRGTARASSPMGRFSAAYTGSGEAVDGLGAANCGEMLLGVPCEVYERSAFIRQSSLMIDQNAELERRIAALITTGEEGRSYTEAAAALKRQLNSRQYNKSGRIPVLEGEITALERAQSELSELTARRDEAESALLTLDAEETVLRAQLAAHDICDAQDARRAAAEAKQHWRSAETEAEQLHRTLAESGTPSREALAQARLNLNSLSVLRAEADAAQRQHAEAEAALAAFDAAPVPRPRSLLPVIFAAAAVFLLLLFVPLLSGTAARIAQAAAGIVVLTLSAREVSRRRRARAAHDAKRDSLDRALQGAQSDAAAQQRLYDSAARELLALLPVSDIAHAPAYLDDALAQYAKADALTRRAQEARVRYELLSAHQWNEVPLPAEPVARPARRREELRAALAELDARRRTAQSAVDYTDGRCRALGDGAALAAELAEKRAALDRLHTEYDAIALAIDALQSANTALQKRFSPALSRRASELFGELTGGRYDRVLLDRSFAALTGASGDGEAHDAQLLSLGALDQLYLAVRLAICETVLPSDEPLPLVLDDALVRFDDTRCAAALELLLRESRTRQILLFTCQHREAAYLAGREGVAVRTLP